MDKTKTYRGYLSNSFIKKLENGLKDLVDYVSSDQDLDMQFRNNYINIYYDGGCALEVRPESLKLDPYYFYLFNKEKKYPENCPASIIVDEFHKTHIEEWRKNRPKEKAERPDVYPQKEQADEILKKIKKSCDSVLEKVKAKEPDYETYFKEVKDVVGLWVQNYARNERRDQHYIACSNRYFTDDNNLVVIDIEFAVSTAKPYNHTKDSKHPNGKIPKFDIIAVDKDGQLYAIELKANLAADNDDSEQSVDGHQNDFNKTIGSTDKDNDFVEEMRNVLKLKQYFQLIDGSVCINNKVPKFAVAYTGDEEGKQKFIEKHKKLRFVDVEKVSDKKFYLRLK
jgi:hypothetical protein